MKFRTRNDRKAPRRRGKTNRIQPTIEAYEPRILLSTGFVQGFAVDSANAAIVGATIDLLNPSDNSVVASTTTNSAGYYVFNCVAPGTYDVSESAAGFSPLLTNADVETTINSASVLAGSNNTEFQVTVEDLSTQSIGLTWTGEYGFDSANWTLNQSSYNLAAPSDDEGEGVLGSLGISLSGNLGDLTSIGSYCSDLFQSVYQNTAFTAQPGLTPSTTTLTTLPSYATNLGELGYLYNTFGTTPPTGQSTSSVAPAGLQLALWSLEYNQMPSSGPMTVTSPGAPFTVNSSTASAIVSAANTYLSEAYGKSEDVYFLNLNTAAENKLDGVAGQSLLSTDLLKFTNGIHAQSTPSITTTAGGPVVLGSGVPLTDSADLSGASDFLAGDTITFALYAQGGVTPVYTTTVPVSNNGTYTVDSPDSTNPGGYVPGGSGTLTGTYQWVVNFSGDNNNTPANTNLGDEPETVTAASSSVSTAIYDSSGGAETDTLGESVNDTATVTGVAGVTPTGSVTYEFFTTANGTGTPTDQTVKLNADGSVPASAATAALAAGSYSYIAIYSGDSNYAGSTGAVEPLTINQGTITVSTTIYNAANGSVVTGALPLGASVYDTVSFSGATAGFTPTLSDASYTFTSPSGTATAGSGGQSTTEGPLGAGSYQFNASFAGDSNYNVAVSSAEPLTINQGTITVSTTIYNAANGSVVTGALPLGASVYDTVSFSGATAGFTPTLSDASYTFTNPNGTATAGSGGQSATEGPLGAGSYQFNASFAGDSNYNVAVSGAEPLTINKGTITVSTTIYNAANGSVVTGALPLGASVYDTVTFSGATAGFTPTLSDASYTFTSPSGTATAGSGGQSTTEGPLGAGSYQFNASFAGDSNYNVAVSSAEPLTINQGTITVTTTIYNAANGSVVTGALPLGASVYDTVTFSGATAGFTPTLSDASYTFTSPSGTANAGSGGQSTTEGPLGAGSYQFNASFAGDSNYNVAVSSAEPLTINQGTITVSTTIYNAANGSVVTGALPLGASVYDTVSFSGATAGFTPTLSDASYTFTNPNGTATAGSGGQSATEGPLGAGSYQFNASFAGDSNYNVAVSGAEPLTINKGTITVSTTIYNAANGSVVTGALPLGASVYDTVTFSGATAGFTPTLSDASYTFTSPSGTATAGSGGQSTTEGPLGAGSYQFNASFAGDSNYNVAVSSAEPLTINQGTITVTTTIYNAANGSVVTGALPLGASVYDTVTFSGATAGFTPTLSDASYTFTSPSGTANAGSGGQSTTEGPLGAGSYQFNASFAGDSNYNVALSGAEPLTINKGTITVSTTIYNAANGSVVTGALPLGASVYDTVSFSGATAGFTPTLSDASYTFTSPSGTANAGSGGQSTTEGPLGAGSYQFNASFAGDSNYNVAVSGAEPLTINKGTITVSTTIYNAANGSVVTGALPLGASVYDTVSFSGATAGFTPTLSDASYTFTSPSGTATAGSGGQSTTEGPLGAGSYQFNASFAGDSNYNVAVSSAEPLTINQGTITVSTTIYNAANGSVVTGALPLGASVYDTVSFSGATAGFTPTLSDASYTFTNPNGTATAGSGGQSATEGPLGAGSYQFNASFAGDSNYNVAVSGAEPLTINKGTITVSTTIYNAANGSVVTGALPLGASVYDTVTFSGATAGFTPTLSDASYTFTSPSGTATAGSGGQSTTEGPLGAGSYQFNASFAGDSNYNVAVSSAEPLTINQGTITVTTTIYNAANGSVVTGALPLGASVYDTVTFSGATAGFTPTLSDASYTFTSPSGTANAGSGGQSTTEGPLGAGSYQFNASFAGDSNYNVAVSSAEPLTVTMATPSLTTTPGGSVALGTSSISGTKYLDVTGNGFSSDDTPYSGVTIDLFKGSSPSGSPYETAVTGSDGTYGFSSLTPGTYSVEEVVPTGYIQTGGGPSGSAGNTYYTVTVAAGQSDSGYTFDDFKIPTCAPTNVSYKVTTPSGHSTTFSSLDGNTAQGDTVTVTFTVTQGMSDQLTLVSYVAPSSSFSDSNAYEQEIYQQATGIFTQGTYTLKVTIPSTYYQIDFVCGQAISQLEPNQNGGAYGPDSANVMYHAEDRFIDSDNSGTTMPSSSCLNSSTPTIPSPTSGSLAVPPLTDSALLSAGYNPMGSITFYLFAPGVTTNTTGAGDLYTDQVTVSGDGSYSTATGSNPGGYIPTMPGTYEWVAVYSGDSNNKSTPGSNLECETVTGKASPSISTTPSTTTGVCGTSEKLTDTATLSGGDAPTGTITFTLYSPSGTLLDTASVTVNKGNGSYTSPSYSLAANAAPGTYQWDASYGGDNNNVTATDINDTSEQVVVGQASPALSTTPNTTTGTCGTSEKLTDMATLSGGYGPSGTITFTLVAPGGTTVDTETVNVNGDGNYTTPNGYTLPTNAAAGTYQWNASYSGNTANSSTSDDDPNQEQVVVTAPVSKGQCATISFWCGSQGQNLIKCLNTGSSCTNLGNWLASTCPNLFGSLKNCSNSQVASYCNTLNNGNSNQKACGQVLSTAISCYVTNNNLAGNAGASCGFTVSSTGAGVCSYNVGSNGSSLGLSNNQSYCLSDLLSSIDSQCQNGSFSNGSSSQNAANSICSAINQTGGV